MTTKKVITIGAEGSPTRTTFRSTDFKNVAEGITWSDETNEPLLTPLTVVKSLFVKYKGEGFSQESIV